MARNFALWLIIAAVMLAVFNNFSTDSTSNRMSYSEFVQEVQRDRVNSVTVDGYTIAGRMSDGTSFEVVRPA
ncbi:MAG: ATP-dependent metallopeptidase FtsH/Yme1/Tma family protein, partial [Pseudomonadales bacterium]